MSGRAAAAVEAAQIVAKWLDVRGEAKLAEDVRRLCRSNVAYRSTLSQLHQDNARLLERLQAEDMG